MQIRAAEISDVIRDQIKEYEKQLEVRETGFVLSAGDGIARIYGLERVAAGEPIEFPPRLFRLPPNPEEEKTRGPLLGGQQADKESGEGKPTRRDAPVPGGGGPPWPGGQPPGGA